MYNYFDVVFALIMLFFIIAGLKTGFIKSLVYLLAGFAGVFIAEKMAAGNAAKFYVIFFIVAGAVLLLVVLFSKFFKKLSGAALDKIAGVAAGVLVGSLFILSVVMPWAYSAVKLRKDLERSYSSKVFQPWFYEHVYQVRNFDIKYFSKRMHMDAMLSIGGQKFSQARAATEKTIYQQMKRGK